jgi:hypothetical protein
MSMKPGIIALLLFACTVAAHGQDSSDVQGGETISLLSLQADVVAFLLDFRNGPLITSISIAEDLDFFVRRESAGIESRFGIQIGINRIDWPDINAEPEKRRAKGYSAVDYDLLGRYTWLTSRLRFDVTAGLTLRDGEYFESSMFYPRTSQVSLGVKWGAAGTLMLIRPVLGIRLKASMFFFGHQLLEAGAIGLGLVVGWQRSPEDG